MAYHHLVFSFRSGVVGRARPIWITVVALEMRIDRQWMPFSPSSVVVGGRDLGPIIPLLRVGNLSLLALRPLRWWDHASIVVESMG